MRSILVKVLVVVLFSGFSSLAAAGFHVEPYLNSTLNGKWKQHQDDGKFKTTNLGIKLGYQSHGGFLIGGELQMGAGEITINNTDNDLAAAAFGLYLGYQDDSGFRLYLSLMSASMGLSDVNTDPTWAGSMTKLGVGYMFVEGFALNLEYQGTTYGKYKDDNTALSNLTHDLDLNTIAIALSFPFNF